ncbi:MAG: 50S ribosomal protein L25 [Acidimicrobiia bacterium]|nr:50S ribosomal protein L25 [Acidimicrobiia bacterium]MBT8249015.1 50S ribosomal protein L25 [Acidimicrobiia bacterium]NNC42150.1 50S ribosomal protein L25 [Acidimicrobiia bacterium]NND13676.1 50S ribosomal protein L25 [Acidimicrobiia bacterium]NNL27187.1 50S ribosomal protein L25 [Acidimicrobiia bacterium]
MSQIALKAEKRPAAGSRAAGRLRRSGMVPANVYGSGLDPMSVAVNAQELWAVLHSEAGANAVIDLDVEGTSVTTLAREIQRHPVRGDIVHLDFIKVSLTETVEAEVVIDFVGEPIGVQEDDSIVETIRNTVQLEALPNSIPSSIEVDISHMATNDVLRVGDLPVMEGVTYLDDEEQPLITVTIPRAVIAEPEEGEEGFEGEEGVEGEEGAEEGDDAEGDGDGDSTGE